MILQYHRSKQSFSKRYLTVILIISVTLSCVRTNAQYYLRGQLKDEQGKGLRDVRITLFSKGNYPFYTGTDGIFGLPSSLKTDTITIIKPGYDTLKTAVITSQFANLVLKASQKRADNAEHLSSYTNGLSYQSIDKYDEEDKNRSSSIENVFVNTFKYPTTSLGLHVNKSGYNKIKRKLLNKEKPTKDEVKIEEILNFFNLKPNNTVTASNETFTLNYQISDCPWNIESKLLFINPVAKKINLDKTPVANFIFLLDASGSMESINKLPVLKNAFKLLTENLRPVDKVTIITYGDVVTQLLPATNGTEKQIIIEAIEGLRPNGNTPGASAIHMAYEKARENYIPGGNNRIIMATDGDFNVGNSGFKGLEELARRESKEGIYLSCLGVGIEKDENLEALAKAGQGHFAYLEDERNAEKVLVEEFAQTIYSVAGNVNLSINFNPQKISQYRLIGFDNKREYIYNNITSLQGGEVGSGESMMAVFEIIMNKNTSDNIGTLDLSFNPTNVSNTITNKYVLNDNYSPTDSVDHAYQMATCLVSFGQMLKQSEFNLDFTWSNLAEQTKTYINNSNLLEKELLELINTAKKIFPARYK